MDIVHLILKLFIKPVKDRRKRLKSDEKCTSSSNSPKSDIPPEKSVKLDTLLKKSPKIDVLKPKSPENEVSPKNTSEPLTARSSDDFSPKTVSETPFPPLSLFKSAQFYHRARMAVEKHCKSKQYLEDIRKKLRPQQ